MLDLHRFMIAVARVSVNHDGRGGTAPDPLVSDQGSRPKVRLVLIQGKDPLFCVRVSPPGWSSVVPALAALLCHLCFHKLFLHAGDSWRTPVLADLPGAT